MPWMCIPQISINCKMLSYQYGPTFLCLQHLVELMPQRIKAVMDERGSNTIYGVPPLGECLINVKIRLHDLRNDLHLNKLMLNFR